MKKTIYLLPFLILYLSACNTATVTQTTANIGQSLLQTLGMNNKTSSSVSNTEISQAFKQALNIGTENVIDQLSTPNGFNLDPKIHIPLPDNMAKIQTTLKKAGMSSLLDDLENRLNLAAETATPYAQDLFVQAIRDMSFSDIMTIYNGPANSATTYFKNKTSDDLAQKMLPFVKDTVNQTGVIQSYDRIIAQYKTIPFVSDMIPNIENDLSHYVVNKGIEGIFFYLAKQEENIRQNPTQHTTALLKKVFGGQKHERY